MGNPADFDPLLLANRRYGRDELRALPGFNATLATQLNHRSVRAFTPEPLADGTLELLLAAAQSAPSSSNLQVWSAVAVQEPARKARLAALANHQAQIVEAPLLLVFLADLSRLRRVADGQGEALAGADYLDTALMGFIDAALAAQNVVTAAESLGLGTVYIGALRNRPEEVAAELGLPPQVSPAFGLVVGHPDPARPTAVKPRLPQRAVLHHEQYSSAPEAAAVAEYDDILQHFQATQDLPQQPWSRQAVARLRGPESLSGRHRLREALTQLGFGLI
ncbi:NADPH-dependent oxidoreductase [Chitiniphilus shinanonensis]|uniref:NADPH-dependent oxidoreductase n=1 Tax=Chitiniphilus shinanonensis TaxID=553088 RepID=A0ABQ6BSE4_9NEIS|nr:NADPH-dependent oxidoreductase [Chitiniphilus shinanonensis]GLS04701.1 NADPH-dependent oxidoreductase [Chitiniphilus shinanonensis]